LKRAREKFEAGRIGEKEFKRMEDLAVDQAIALQERVGLDVITDGEMRRYAFYGHLIDAVEASIRLADGRSRFATKKVNDLR